MPERRYFEQSEGFLVQLLIFESKQRIPDPALFFSMRCRAHSCSRILLVISLIFLVIIFNICYPDNLSVYIHETYHNSRAICLQRSVQYHNGPAGATVRLLAAGVLSCGNVIFFMMWRQPRACAPYRSRIGVTATTRRTLPGNRSSPADYLRLPENSSRLVNARMPRNLILFPSLPKPR